VAWLDDQPAESIWITTVTLFEAQYGLAQIAHGQRRNALTQRLEELLLTDLQNRVLGFDAPAAEQAAALSPQRKALGRLVDMRDTFIAGIALARRATLDTRNTRHFDDLATPVVNPWAE
jgi:predicted nucleic acid-binding protein